MCLEEIMRLEERCAAFLSSLPLPLQEKSKTVGERQDK